MNRKGKSRQCRNGLKGKMNLLLHEVEQNRVAVVFQTTSFLVVAVYVKASMTMKILTSPVDPVPGHTVKRVTVD
jgi:hypothetical protein